VSEPLTLDQVRADIAELLYLSPSDVDDSADLLTEGLDSVRILSLVERWREAGADINFMQLAEAPTVAAWWRLLSTHQPGHAHG
jgi:bifunctional isochorismate lyase/aryl carrier protein